MSSIPPRTIKIVLLGNKRAGKTSLANMFVHSLFQDRTVTSVGGHFMTKTLEEPRVTLQIWDAAAVGKSMFPGSVRGIDCAILVYDLGDRDSFLAIRDFWIGYVKSGASEEMVKILVGTKSDTLVRAVQESEGKSLARQNGMMYMETSARLRINVDKVFTEAAEAVLETMYLQRELNDETEPRLFEYKREKRRFCLISQ